MRLQLLALTALPALTSAAYCSGKPSPDAQPNLHPIMTPTPTIIRSVPNAVLQRLGTGDDNISVVHLWGSAYAAHRSRKFCAILWRKLREHLLSVPACRRYEKGVAHGQLMKDNMQAFFNGAYGYFEDQFVEAINGSVPWIPQKVAEYIAEIGLGAGLDLTYDLTKKYTGAHFEDEMRGLADGCACGVTVQQIRRVHMIGELTKGACSMFGAWGDATADGGTLQLRCARPARPRAAAAAAPSRTH